MENYPREGVVLFFFCVKYTTEKDISATKAKF